MAALGGQESLNGLDGTMQASKSLPNHFLLTHDFHLLNNSNIFFKWSAMIKCPAVIKLNFYRF